VRDPVGMRGLVGYETGGSDCVDDGLVAGPGWRIAQERHDR